MQEAWKQQGHEVDNKRIKLESLSIHDRSLAQSNGSDTSENGQ